MLLSPEAWTKEGVDRRVEVDILEQDLIKLNLYIFYEQYRDCKKYYKKEHLPKFVYM